MGNTESQVLETTAALDSKLSLLEEKLDSIESNDQYSYTWPEADTDVRIFGVPVMCRNDVKVLIGPVIGAVSHDTVTVLLEIDCEAEVSFHVSVITQLAPQGRYVKTVRKELQASVPTVVKIDELRAGQRYTVVLGGVCKEDATDRVGRFSTVNLETNQLNVMVVSGDNPAALRYGEKNMWKKALELTRNYLDPVHVVVHAGEQVAMKQAFDDALMVLSRHANSKHQSHLAEAGWEAMEQKAYEIMREVYYLQWNLANVRQVLASASNLMIWGEGDVYPGFTHNPDFRVDRNNPTKSMRVVRTVLRAARRLYHEYQRQLWDSEIDTKIEAEYQYVNAAEKFFDLSEQLNLVELKKLSAEDAMVAARNRADFAVAKELDKQIGALGVNLEELRDELDEVDKEIVVMRGEEYVQVMGSIGFLVLDMRGNRLYPDGSQATDNTLLNNIQWEFLETICSDDETSNLASVELLVVVSEFPVIDSTASVTDHLLQLSSDNEYMYSFWSAHPGEQNRLLRLLSNWKFSKPRRDVVFVSGSTKRGFKTTVTDVKMKSSFQQLVSGPIANITSPTTLWEEEVGGVLLHDRFEFKHTFLPPETNFGIVRLSTSGIEVSQYKQIDESARMVLGPIIGAVSSTTAVILVEIDRSAPVICVLQNTVVPSERHSLQIVLSPLRPTRFVFSRLSPNQQYDVSFIGIACPSSRKGSVHTMDSNPSHLRVAMVCRDKGTCSNTLWESLARSLSTPFSDIDIVLHLGGQVYTNDSVGTSEALAILQSVDDDESAIPPDALEGVKARLRNIYKSHWNLPHIRESLANGSHLMVWYDPDISFEQECSEKLRGILKSLMRQVFFEYQGQVNNPTSYYFQQYGSSFGIFALDITPKESGTTTPFIAEEQFEALTSVMHKVVELKTLVIASPIPLIEDSVDDNIEKIRCGSTAAKRNFSFNGPVLIRLLKLLCAWQSEKRKVVVLTGSDYCGLETLVQQVAALDVKQHHVTVGPISDTPSIYEKEMDGAIGNDLIYSHGSHQSFCQFAHVTLEEGVVTTFVSNDEAASFSESRLSLPPWLEAVRTKEEVEYDDEENEELGMVASILDDTKEALCNSFDDTNVVLFPSDSIGIARLLLPSLESYYNSLSKNNRLKLVRPTLLLTLLAVEYRPSNLQYAVINEDYYVQIALGTFKEAAVLRHRIK